MERQFYSRPEGLEAACTLSARQFYYAADGAVKIWYWSHQTCRDKTDRKLSAAASVGWKQAPKLKHTGEICQAKTKVKNTWNDKPKTESTASELHALKQTSKNQRPTRSVFMDASQDLFSTSYHFLCFSCVWARRVCLQINNILLEKTLLRFSGKMSKKYNSDSAAGVITPPTFETKIIWKYIYV